MKPIIITILFFLIASCTGSDNQMIYGEWIEVKRDLYNINLPDSLINKFTWDDNIPEDAQYLIFNEDGTSYSGSNRSDLLKMNYSLKDNELIFFSSRLSFTRYRNKVLRLDDKYLITEYYEDLDKTFGSTSFLIRSDKLSD